MSEKPKQVSPSIHCIGVALLSGPKFKDQNRLHFTSISTKSFFPSSPFLSNFRLIPIQSQSKPHNRNSSPKPKHGTIRLKGNKENVWSLDNELAKPQKQRDRATRKNPKGRRVIKSRRNKGGTILVSGAMLMEVETVLQTQEPVIKPNWNTFVSSVSGIWKGVGAVFSPITAEMEPIEIGSNNENLYDCYTLSCVDNERFLSGEQTNQIKRRVNWVTLNPYGETPLNPGDASSTSETMVGRSPKSYRLPSFESFNFDKSDVLEEDVMGNEPGLVFFEDGSYSRGPVNIPVGDVDDTNYYINPTFKFEQCLVKGCHKRLRIVHTIEFSGGGSDIQILRVAVYEEQWVSPANMSDISDVEFDLKPFSQRKRTDPSELSGSWKVFEVSGTPIFGEESNAGSYVYLCTETLKKRRLPENPVYFGEEEVMDMQDVTMLWLPGGVTAYVDVKNDGILCIGVGWYSDEGINLVMERDYGSDGNLKEVRWKSELKRRWPDPIPV
ncbi:uncharacterized protein E5676_scaffold291G00250 [Cucumis melo var. makuwa]|uniref:Uncharacterized protein n=1 Tax=Cucumis melo var. makuwa TaxID=1194695 RepID=A0A5D3DB54_CUCMM|nr:uncharacterized protein E6C27_scaffold171G00250 [Cucumis melo var. makuwa]TYK20765.1 uncharacterized protein E5676_scaffold291G00250 [Cucumis melo var. makuwa]